MEDISHPFDKAGKVLIVIGVLDILFMIYAINNKMSYSSSFNIFSIIAGVYLTKGSVKAARNIRWFGAFLITAFTGMYLLMPLSMPIQLTIVQFKLHTSSMLFSYIFGFMFIGILVWVYLQLSSKPSLALLKEAGYNIGKPKSALYIAIAFMTLGVVLASLFLNGESAQRAKLLAKEQLGSEYKYHVTNISTSGNRGSAVVTAYNSTEIRNIRVKW